MQLARMPVLLVKPCSTGTHLRCLIRKGLTRWRTGVFRFFRCLEDVFVFQTPRGCNCCNFYTLCVTDSILIHINTFVFRSFFSTLMISDDHYHLQHLFTCILFWTNNKFISELNLSCNSPCLMQVEAFSLPCKLQVLWNILRMTIKCRLYKSYALFKNEYFGVPTPQPPSVLFEHWISLEFYSRTVLTFWTFLQI